MHYAPFSKHLQPKTVRFTQYKHKLSPWMTKVILISIKLRDKSFRKLKSTPETSPLYAVLEHNLFEYKTLLKSLSDSPKQNIMPSNLMKTRQIADMSGQL